MFRCPIEFRGHTHVAYTIQEQVFRLQRGRRYALQHCKQIKSSVQRLVDWENDTLSHQQSPVYLYPRSAYDLSNSVLMTPGVLLNVSAWIIVFPGMMHAS